MKSDLIRIYNNTAYHVPELDLVILPGQENVRLKEVLSQYGAHTFAFITAYNPQGIETAKVLNIAAHQRLIGDIIHAGMDYMEGFGQGSDGWVDENSLFIPGISLKEALSLARKYRQNAFVFGEKAGLPVIVWTADE